MHLWASARQVRSSAAEMGSSGSPSELGRCAEEVTLDERPLPRRTLRSATSLAAKCTASMGSRPSDDDLVVPLHTMALACGAIDLLARLIHWHH